MPTTTPPPQRVSADANSMKRSAPDENLDLEDRIVKAVGAGCSERIAFAKEFMDRIPGHLAHRARLWIVANRLYWFSTEEARQFKAEIIEVNQYSNEIFNECLTDLILSKNEEVFFYVVELLEESIAFDRKRLKWMIEAPDGMRILSQSPLDIIEERGTFRMKLWAKKHRERKIFCVNQQFLFSSPSVEYDHRRPA